MTLKAKEVLVLDAMKELGICTTQQVSDAVGFPSQGSIKSLESKGIVFKAGRADRAWRWSL